MPAMQGFAIALLLFVAFLTNATTITVDDADPQWVYNPPPGNTSVGFEAISPSTPCPLCGTVLDATRVLNFTWHDAIIPMTAQLSFTGVSIGIYIICPENNAISLTFMLDDVDGGSFILGSDGRQACSQFEYDYLVYARTNLTLGPHIVTIANTPLQNGNRSNILLDYAVYDDGNDTSSSGVPSSSPSSAPSSSSPSIPPLPTARKSIPTSVIAIISALAGMLLASLGHFIYHRISGGRRRTLTLNLDEDDRTLVRSSATGYPTLNAGANFPSVPVVSSAPMPSETWIRTSQYSSEPSGSQTTTENSIQAYISTSAPLQHPSDAKSSQPPVYMLHWQG